MTLAVIIASARPIHASTWAELDSDCISKRQRATILQQKPLFHLQIGQYERLPNESSLAYSANTRGWLAGSSLEGWIAVDTIAIITPAINAIDPILSKGRN